VVARYFQDYPPSDGPADVRPAQDGHRYAMPWHAMLTSRNLWLLGAMYACASFSWYFNITYFPSFLETRYGLAPDSITAGVLKGGPLLLGGFGCLIGGYWTDRLLRKLGSRRWARRIPPLVGHGACGVCYLVAVFAGSAWTAALAISLAAFANDLMMGAAWASCQDIGRRHTAVTAGWMNTCGNLGGAFSGWAIGTILEQAPAGRAAAGNTLDRQASLSIGYEICLYSFAAVSFVAMFIWFGIRADQPLADD
jgi:predicted MFS family arabinose efflux permease